VIVSSSQHWDDVYARTPADQLSWYQRTPDVSFELIARAGLAPGDPIIDVGGGASCFVDALMDAGFADVSVLDISRTALAQSQARVGAGGDRVRWICADVTTWQPSRAYRLWHDRAVFHFLAEAADQERYAKAAAAAVAPDGWMVLATFAPDGPTTCSGRPVVRWDSDGLAARFAPDFVAVDEQREEHLTPSGLVQPFTWVLLRHR
jgi:trans-aconitate methyltransferase